MLVQILKQRQHRLRKLKVQKNISIEDAKEIERIEKWFKELSKEE